MSVGRSLNVYAVYRMRVIFQNSRHGTMLYRFLRYLSFNTPTLNVGFYNLKITFQCICMFSVSETARSAHICVFSLSPFRKESWSASHPGVCYAGHKMCTRCTGTENSCVRVRSNACASPCNLRAGHLKKKDAPCLGPNVSAGYGPRCVRCVQNARNFSK